MLGAHCKMTMTDVLMNPSDAELLCISYEKRRMGDDEKRALRKKRLDRMKG